MRLDDKFVQQSHYEVNQMQKKLESFDHEQSNSWCQLQKHQSKSFLQDKYDNMG